MGIIVRGKGITDLGAGSFLQLPYTEGLQGIYIPALDPTNFGRNFANRKLNAQIVGSPVLNSDGSVRFTHNANYLKTGIVDNEKHSIYVIAKTAVTDNTGSARPVYYTNGITQPSDPANGTIASFGVTLTPYRDPSVAGGNLSFNVGHGDTTSNQADGSAIVTLTSHSNFGLHVGRCDATTSRLDALTANLTNSRTAQPLPRLLVSGQFQIGSSPNRANTGHCDIMMVVHFTGVYHTDQQRDEIVQVLRRFVQKQWPSTLV